MSRRMIPFDEAVSRGLLTRAGIEGASNRRQLELMRKSLDRAIQEVLTPLERKELALYYIKEMTLAEIGALTGTCPSTVMRNIRRAIKKLRRALSCCAFVA